MRGSGGPLRLMIIMSLMLKCNACNKTVVVRAQEREKLDDLFLFVARVGGRVWGGQMMIKFVVTCVHVHRW